VPQNEPSSPPSSAVVADCAGRHGLVRFFTPEDGWYCSACHAADADCERYATGSPMYGCRTCDEDLCVDCYAHPPEQFARRSVPMSPELARDKGRKRAPAQGSSAGEPRSRTLGSTRGGSSGPEQGLDNSDVTHDTPTGVTSLATRGSGGSAGSVDGGGGGGGRGGGGRGRVRGGGVAAVGTGRGRGRGRSPKPGGGNRGFAEREDDAMAF